MSEAKPYAWTATGMSAVDREFGAPTVYYRDSDYDALKTELEAAALGNKRSFSET